MIRYILRYRYSSSSSLTIHTNRKESELYERGSRIGPSNGHCDHFWMVSYGCCLPLFGKEKREVDSREPWSLSPHDQGSLFVKWKGISSFPVFCMVWGSLLWWFHNIWNCQRWVQLGINLKISKFFLWTKKHQERNRNGNLLFWMDKRFYIY